MEVRGHIYDVPRSFLAFPKMVHSLSFPSCTQPPHAGSHKPPSENPGYGPVVNVSLSSSIITTQQHGERDSKEAGRQLSSFTNLGDTVTLLHVDTMGELAGEKQTKIHAKISSGTLSSWIRISWANHSCQNFIPKHAHIHSPPKQRQGYLAGWNPTRSHLTYFYLLEYVSVSQYCLGIARIPPSTTLLQPIESEIGFLLLGLTQRRLETVT